MSGSGTLLLLWAALAAQAPDSALGASLSAVRGAGVRFRHDLHLASPQLVLARARDVSAACGLARATADSLATRAGLSAAAREELAVLRRALAICVREWDLAGPRAHADSLRAWGPNRLSALDAALRRYQQRGRAPADRPSD